MLNNIADNLEQCGQQNIVQCFFIRPEQVVRFLLCTSVYFFYFARSKFSL